MNVILGIIKIYNQMWFISNEFGNFFIDIIPRQLDNNAV